MSESENAGSGVTPSAPEGIPSPDEARGWLKQSGLTPDLSIDWRASAPDEGAYRTLLDILFAPRGEDYAA